MSEIDLLDLSGFAWFLLCWIGYTIFSDRGAAKGANLVGAMARQRESWMRQMLARDNRMVDIQIIRNLNRTSAFFASTSILILAGLVTVLGSTDRAIQIVADVPLVSELTLLQWEVRLLGLILIFVYAFFKYAWSVRLLGYASIQVGAMVPSSAVDEDCERRCLCIANIVTLAGKHSNRGLRGYYFAAALAASFIHPIALMIATTWLVLVLYRREFHSRTLHTLRASESGGSTGAANG